MYEAPDRYKRMISARLPGGESLGLTSRDGDGESSPLRDVQLISRAQLAPFFAAANIVAALMMAAILWGEVEVDLADAWCGAVAGVNLGAMQLARTQSITHVGRSGHQVPQWLMIGEVTVARSAVAQPAAVHVSGLDRRDQVIAASMMAGLGIGALGLVVVPPCVTAWMSAFTAGVCVALLLGPAHAFRSSTCCRSCSRSEWRFSACSPSPAGRFTS